jgi:hypothetical protein
MDTIYDEVSILVNSNNSREKLDFFNAKVSFSGNYLIIESDLDGYISGEIFELSKVNKIKKVYYKTGI